MEIRSPSSRRVRRLPCGLSDSIRRRRSTLASPCSVSAGRHRTKRRSCSREKWSVSNSTHRRGCWINTGVRSPMCSSLTGHFSMNTRLRKATAMSTPTIPPTSTSGSSRKHRGVRARIKRDCGPIRQPADVRATQKCPRHHEVCVHTEAEGAGFLLYTSQMHSQLVNTWTLLLLTTIMVAAVSLGTAHAADLARNPELCDKLFNLRQGTITRPPDAKVMSPEVCAAYQFLISRYTPGPRSSTGLSNPKVEGVIKLNPDFALVVAKMLQSAPYMVINSAYRTPEGQGSKDPQSNHIYGCAVDLGYDQTSCNSATCQWVLRNSGAYGLHIRMKYSPEWNHIEPIAKDACRNNSQDVGIQIASAPSSNLSDFARQLFGPNTPQPPTSDQNCTLSDGRVVPCSSIANQGNMTNPNNMSLGTPPQQSLPASQQPTQYMQQ